MHPEWVILVKQRNLLSSKNFHLLAIFLPYFLSKPLNTLS